MLWLGIFQFQTILSTTLTGKGKTFLYIRIIHVIPFSKTITSERYVGFQSFKLVIVEHKILETNIPFIPIFCGHFQRKIQFKNPVIDLWEYIFQLTNSISRTDRESTYKVLFNFKNNNVYHIYSYTT